MQLEVAADASNFSLASRPMDEDRSEIYDVRSGGFFILHSDTDQDGTRYRTERKPGRGSKNKDDWSAVNSVVISKTIEAWKAEQEERGLVIEKPWEMACMASPVNRAMRTTKKNEWMLRTGDKDTWVTNSNRTYLGLMTGGVFKKYDGWESVSAVHILAKVPLQSGHGPYNLVSYSYDGKKATYKIEEPVEKKPKNPNAATSAVHPETIFAAGTIVQTLGEALKSCDKGDKQRIIDEMLKISKQVSWHLREDRAKWQ